MNIAKIVRFSCMFVALLSILLLRTGVEAADSPHGKFLHLDPFAHWASTVTNNRLSDVGAIAPNNVWAVGDYQNTGSSSKTLAEHWNGITWSIIPTPSPGANLINDLFSVAAIAPNNVWAVGDYGNNTSTQTLIEHWNGTTWSVMPSPNPGGSTGINALNRVAATSANDIWAVGYYYSSPFYRSLVEHWNGATWSVIPTPQVGSLIDYFSEVLANSTQDIWAIGEFANNTSNATYQTLTEHWDGSTWSVMPSPNPGGAQQNTYIFGATVISSSNMLISGEYDTTNSGQTLIAHWDGSVWTAIQSPNPGSTIYGINDITAGATNDIWATGYYTDKNNIFHTLTEHWNGTAWRIVPSPNFGGSGASNTIYASQALSSKNVWSVGITVIGKGNSQVLIEHWNGSSWSIVPPGH